MQKRKYYYNTKFSIEVITSGYNKFLSFVDKSIKDNSAYEYAAEKNKENWKYDTYEEFSSSYYNAEQYSIMDRTNNKWFAFSGDSRLVRLTVESDKRSEIEAVFQVFESKLLDSAVEVVSEPVKIFIGHGGNSQWRDLKDHLHEKHGFEVITYEIGPRAGLSIKEVLQSMLTNSSFALLILTGEDIDKSGNLHARENVIHELGLFQGKLGFTRAIAVLENNVNEFSNIAGLNQIRFAKGNIKETYGEILATIKREFNSK